jgi:beta-lactamase superfamily II metal-dependent hydrolase
MRKIDREKHLVVDCVVNRLRENELDTPDPTEIEMTFLGPGFGESSLIHVGDGNWIAVDSCVDSSTQLSRVLSYFEKIGISPASLRMIVATHWHDDHIRGLSQLVEAAPGADFVCSAAVQTREFYTLVASAKRTLTATPSGVAEMAKILDLIESRQGHNGTTQRTPIWAKENLLLFDSTVGSRVVRLHALSPSDWSMTRAWQSLGRLVPTLMQPKRALPAPGANESSVVLWLVIDDVCALFGADLEETVNSATGWKRVVANPLRTGHGAVIKVPHHGSMNAVNTDVWRTMLVSDPVAVIVPFRKGDVVLPRDEAIKLYCSLTRNLFLTVRPGTRRVHRRRGAVDRILRSSVQNLTEVLSEDGIVRVRIRGGGEGTSVWNVGLMSPAYAACS